MRIPYHDACNAGIRPEGPTVNRPDRKASLLPTGETAGRPEGPTVNRPDRKVGITQLSEMSAEGAALQGMFTPSAAPSTEGAPTVLILILSTYPGLTASLLPTGETAGRPEGPTVNRPDRKVGITQ